ncbi:hypothetical protein [Jeotgalibacillus aurantiacus]|uniref:hypothetical protein n=1 Tax=Jeotgalibacillus aurantiacus TaxID=2763266 RepID=UPI001D0B166A|nr:hypothetical protein [Jeotgalibacillus aurantiacus]
MEDHKWELLMKYQDFDYIVEGTFKTVNQHLSLAINHLKNQEENQGKLKIMFEVSQTAPSNLQKVIPDHETSEVGNEKLTAFINELGTRIEWLYALGVSYFLSEKLGEKLISAKSIKTMYNQAGIQLPKNIHLCINQCVRKKFLEPIGKSEKQKTYFITESGKAFIEKQIVSDNENKKVELYESAEQKKLVESFMRQLTEKDRKMLNATVEMEQRIILFMYLLKKHGMKGPVRPNIMYILMVKLYGYDGLIRSVHLGLSRTRPLTKKLKLFNKVHYTLTDEGTQWIETLHGNITKTT